MEDHFKNALKKAREKLEQDKPSPEVWEKLKSKLEVNLQPKKLSIAARHKYKFAAAAGIILLVLSYIIFKNTGITNRQPGSDLANLPKENSELRSVPGVGSNDKQSVPGDTAAMYRRYEHDMRVYKNQVAEQEKKIEIFLIDEPAVQVELDKGVSELRIIFTDLEKKLAGEIGKEQILQMMVSNLRLQEKVLNNQLALLQHLKKEKDEEL